MQLKKESLRALSLGVKLGNLCSKDLETRGHSLQIWVQLKKESLERAWGSDLETLQHRYNVQGSGVSLGPRAEVQGIPA